MAQTEVATPSSPPLVLPLARYRFSAVLRAPLDLPDDPGSLLRSVFGAALRETVCSTGRAQCDGCALRRSCGYSLLFETPPRPTQFDQQFSQVPHPYVIEPPSPGQRIDAGQPLTFCMVLIGDWALGQLGLVAHAWQLALRRGLGPQRAAGDLVQVEWLGPAGGEAVLDAMTGAIRPHAPALTLPASAAAQAVALHFHTPLRLQRNGQILRPAQLTPRTLVSHLLRRVNLVLDLHLGLRPAPFDAHALVALADTLADDRSALVWQDVKRYSARQRQEVPLSGVTGRWTLRGDLAPFMPWLALGQWLHLGKSATMGLGGYRLQAEPTIGTTPAPRRHAEGAPA